MSSPKAKVLLWQIYLGNNLSVLFGVYKQDKKQYHQNYIFLEEQNLFEF